MSSEYNARKEWRILLFLGLLFCLFGVFGIVRAGFDQWAFREISRHGIAAEGEVSKTSRFTAPFHGTAITVES